MFCRNLGCAILALGISYLSPWATAASHQETDRQVYLFPSASDLLREGFVRVINHSARAGEVTIVAVDDSGRRYNSVTLSIDANETVHFNSRDLETGNAGKGLAGNTGPGEGAWRLGFSSDLNIEVLSYIRTEDGFLTAMHDVAPAADGTHRVAIFNPGSNDRQRSRLRLINPTNGVAEITIRGRDDSGSRSVGQVSVSLGAGAAREITASALEAGTGTSFDGTLGDGSGKWRLEIVSGQAIVAMSLLESPSGHLTNLSTAPARGTGRPPPRLQSSYELQKTSLHIDRQAIRQTNPGTFVLAVAYGDFDNDRDEDVFMAGGDGSESGTPVELYANDGTGQFTLANEIFQHGIPELVHPRKVLPGDFNGDGRLDVFIAGHGYDREPFPGESPVLLLSSDAGLRIAEGLDDWVGYFHGAAAADVDDDGDADVVLTDFFAPILLLNNGRGEFTDAPDRMPPRGAFTPELVDVDMDGYVDLLLAGHEDANRTEIYWGDRSGAYAHAEKTVLPTEPGQDTVVDIDADDLNGDGIRDIVVTRTGGGDNFYQGYYIQLLVGQGNRQFVDATENLDAASSTDEWIDWVRLQDINGDGHRDIVVDDRARGLIWLNNGVGGFDRSAPE